MNLERIEMRQIYLLVGSLSFLSLTAIVMFLGKPLYERYDQVSWELASLREVEYTNASDALSRIESEVSQLEQALLGDFQNIPTRQLEAHIIAALQDSAWRSDIDLLSIEPLEQVAGLPYEEIAFRLEIQGQYFNLNDWIDAVSSQLGYVVFKEYVMKISQDGRDPVLNARLLLSAYRVEPS